MRDASVLASLRGQDVARSSHSTLSKVAIWIAIYAFVLNTILASVLISSVPAQALAGADMFCGSMQGASPLDQGDDATSAIQHATAHCKQCCANHAGVALPSAGLQTFDRVGVTGYGWMNPGASYIEPVEIVALYASKFQPAGWRSGHDVGRGSLPEEMAPRLRQLDLPQSTRRTAIQNVPARLARPGPDVHDPVRVPDDVELMLHDEQ